MVHSSSTALSKQLRRKRELCGGTRKRRIAREEMIGSLSLLLHDAVHFLFI
jgi:hypothetical protein